MRALRYHEYGGPEVLKYEEVPIPDPAEGEVQIKVAGSGVNPLDWKLREGYMKAFMPVSFPAIVSTEFSGTVTKLGAGVNDFNIGDEVYGLANSGSCAEYTTATAATIGLKPATMDLADAAGVPVGGMTAWEALFVKGNVQPGQKVLIHAASGGVGSFAVQLAKWKGAHVIGTTSARNQHFVTELGADEVIDYHTTDFSTVLSDIDFVLDTIGGETTQKSLSVLKPGGIVVTLTGGQGEAEGKTLISMAMQPTREYLDTLVGLINDLQLKPVIDTVVPFEKAIELQKESQGGRSIGKLVVRVS